MDQEVREVEVIAEEAPAVEEDANNNLDLEPKGDVASEEEQEDNLEEQEDEESNPEDGEEGGQYNDDGEEQ